MPLGNSELAGIAYFSGDPSSAQVVGFDVAKGTLVIDADNGTVYQKTGPQGTNTGGYSSIGRQIKAVTTAGSYTVATLADVDGLTGFTIEAGAKYKFELDLPATTVVATAHGLAINLVSTTAPALCNFATTGMFASSIANTIVASASTSIVLYSATTASLLNVKVVGYFVAGATAGTAKIQASQVSANASASTITLGGTVTLTKIV